MLRQNRSHGTQARNAVADVVDARPAQHPCSRVSLLMKREHMQFMTSRQPLDERKEYGDDAVLAAAIDTPGYHECKLHAARRSAPRAAVLAQQAPQRFRGLPRMSAAAQLDVGHVVNPSDDCSFGWLVCRVRLTRLQPL